jgi:hypothetical protein
MNGNNVSREFSTNVDWKMEISLVNKCLFTAFFPTKIGCVMLAACQFSSLLMLPYYNHSYGMDFLITRNIKKSLDRYCDEAPICKNYLKK